MLEIIFTSSFRQRLKRLSKRYRQIKRDIQPIIDELEEGNLMGGRIPGVSSIVFKVRSRNSDIPIGKSGGYRLTYQVCSPTEIALLLVYAKSDQSDISSAELESLILQVSDE